MKTEQFRCRHCRKMHTAQVAGQKYCNNKRCQQARKNSWGKEKYACDPDYRANQRASTQTWLESKGGAAAYYREYRRRRKGEEGSMPPSSSGAAEKQGVDHGDASLFAPEPKGMPRSANRDAMYEDNLLKPGRYVIFPAHAKGDANRDAILVQIDLISTS